MIQINPKTLAFGLKIFELLITKGPAVVAGIFDMARDNDPTLEDIDGLHDLVMKPEDY